MERHDVESASDAVHHLQGGSEAVGGATSCEKETSPSKADVPKRTQKRRPRPCRYFNTPKGCKLGDSCPFRHPKKRTVDDVNVVEEEIQTEPPKPYTAVASRIIVPPNVKSARFEPTKVVVAREEIDENTQLFPNCTHSSTDTGDVITFNYQVSDPDWVFDVRTIKFRIVFQRCHPLDIPSVTVPSDCNRALPKLLLSHMERCSNEAVKVKYAMFESKNAYEPIGKILIRWIDNNILSVFVEGLKKTKLVREAEEAGIHLVVPSHDLAQSNGESDVKCKTEENLRDFTQSENKNAVPALIDTLERSRLSDEECGPKEAQVYDGINSTLQNVPQIEVSLIWRDSSRNIASITSIRLHICSKCIRCGQEHDTAIPVDGRTVGWRCKRCQIAQSIRLRPELVHENSSVMALLDARGCRPLDCILQQSQLKFVCLGCGREDDVQKLNFGTTHKSWCRDCHALCEFTVSAVRFRGDLSKIPNEDLVTASKIPKTKKEVKVIGSITEGQPLPELGTCKHYKKSYRWFRFPCCGRAFPCDTCHEEFVGGEHEMKVANRMICGHCSKEQVYADGKPCVSCNSSLTRNRSHFWEGGKGCRDPLMMNRNDVHKFVHAHKTTSRRKGRSTAQKN
ncbi:hypothetical protein RB195_018176 [Necator americanus]|uniref:CHY zinc finger n=1 Tax=Necator americanus TaxID=51031 RepID=A0ABR1C8J7_NECAM